jgi:nitrogen fixation NifU-like protein
MMEELRELYQQVILDHNKSPKNFKKLEHPTHSSEGYNPLCGDKISLELQVEGQDIKDVGFQGSGCAISKASASVMTSLVKGKSRSEAEAMFKEFQKLITGEIKAPNFEELGKLAVFAGVREFPARVKCAALAWHTLMAALKEKDDVVTTEK